MRYRIFVVLFLAFFCQIALGQTKEETYEYLNDKIGIFRLNTLDAEYHYFLKEVELNGLKSIGVFKSSSYYPTWLVSDIFEPTEFVQLTTENKIESIWITLNCKTNSVLSQTFEETNELVNAEAVSEINFILKKEIPSDEILKIKKAFLHLLKLYGVEKKDLFD